MRLSRPVLTIAFALLGTAAAFGDDAKDEIRIGQTRLGFRDPLTGLCNRAVFVEGLGRRLDEFKHNRASRFAARIR